ncbi:MAG: cell division protein ZapB [Candidatus Aminicenantes bacterium]|nr:cell division protein ZapB [Candidatus Aminicenantes bacterium]
MSTELDRMKILETKISHVIEYITKLSAENEKLKQQIKDFRIEKKDMEELAKRAGKLDEDLKRYENERDLVRGKVEAIIGQIDKLGI